MHQLLFLLFLAVTYMFRSILGTENSKKRRKMRGPIGEKNEIRKTYQAGLEKVVIQNYMWKHYHISPIGWNDYYVMVNELKKLAAENHFIVHTVLFTESFYEIDAINVFTTEWVSVKDTLDLIGHVYDRGDTDKFDLRK